MLQAIDYLVKGRLFRGCQVVYTHQFNKAHNDLATT
jgi:hypothetical protein